MTHAEFGKRLDQLREAMTRGLAYYAVWKALRLPDKGRVHLSLEEQNVVLGRFRGFFSPVGFALLDMALIQFAKMFDTNQRTVSLTNLLRAAQRDSSLVPHVSPADLREISREIKRSRSLRDSLKRRRDQQLAHLDANPAPVDPLLTREFDKLAECVKSAFNTLSTGHDHNFFSLESLERTSEQDTAEVLDVLFKDIGRKQQEYEDKMVSIGVEHVQREEAKLGIRLNTEARQSTIRSLGLSEEQVKRVEKAYTSDKTASVQS